MAESAAGAKLRGTEVLAGSGRYGARGGGEVG